MAAAPYTAWLDIITVYVGAAHELITTWIQLCCEFLKCGMMDVAEVTSVTIRCEHGCRVIFFPAGKRDRVWLSGSRAEELIALINACYTIQCYQNMILLTGLADISRTLRSWVRRINLEWPWYDDSKGSFSNMRPYGIISVRCSWLIMLKEQIFLLGWSRFYWPFTIHIHIYTCRAANRSSSSVKWPRQAEEVI